MTPWTADWYRRASWETARGPDFYADGVFDRRLGGDLQGVLDRVPYLDSLGVTAVYFNPVFWAASLHKYDATSYHHIDPFFGPDPQGDIEAVRNETSDPATWVMTSADRLFFELVDAFHQRGIKVVLDGVFNHTGTRFWAFADVAQNQQASPYADWYEVTAWDDPATPESEFDWNGWWGYKPLVVLSDNADGTDLHPDVKAHVFDATRRWMDPNGDGDPSDGIDGWRLDVAGEVPDAFWRDWNAFVREINPETLTVAEEWGDATGTLARAGFQSTMNYHALSIPLDGFAYDGRTRADTFAAEVVERFQAYPPATRPALMNVLAGHDTDRLASMIVNGPLGANYDRQAGPRDTTAYQVRAPNATERELQRAVVAFPVRDAGRPPSSTTATRPACGAATTPTTASRWSGPTWPTGPRRTTRSAWTASRTRSPFDHDLFACLPIGRRPAPRRRRAAPRRRCRCSPPATAPSPSSGPWTARRRVVAFNAGDRDAFLELPGAGVPTPLVPVMASRGDASEGAVAGGALRRRPRPPGRRPRRLRPARAGPHDGRLPPRRRGRRAPARLGRVAPGGCTPATCRRPCPTPPPPDASRCCCPRARLRRRRVHRGAGGRPHPVEPVVIRIWHQKDAAERVFLEQWVAAYNARQDTVRIETLYKETEGAPQPLRLRRHRRARPGP